MDIKEFALKYIEAQKKAWQGDFDDLETLEQPDVVFHMAPLMPDEHGWEGHKQYLTNALNSVTELKQEWDYITGDGNVFAISYKVREKLAVANPALNIPAGATVTGDMMFVGRLDSGKLAKMWIKGSIATE